VVALEIRRNALLNPEVRREDTHAVVLLSGELDASTAGQLYEQLAELTREGVVHVDLDLAGLEFMDSTGLSVVIAEHKRTSASGGELVILSPQSQVRRMFEITGLTDILHIRSEEGSEPGIEDTAGEVDPV
jgi:anti-sigma B factor antagonist